MNDTNQKQLGNTLWKIADELRGAMNADDFRDYMLAFLFLRYLSDNYETAAKKELGKDYPKVGSNGSRPAGPTTQPNGSRRAALMVAENQASYTDDRQVPLAIWYAENPKDVKEFEKQMRRKVHYVIKPEHLWNSIANMARTQDSELLNTLQAGFKYIETESFESTFQGLFSEINLGSEKLGKKYEDRKATRVVPLFPELRTFLDEAYFRDDADKTWVVPMLAGDGNKNLGTRIRKIIRRAGVEVWPKPFQNCRSSRQTELEQQYPTYVVCDWMGNTPKVAHKHYLTLMAEHFSKAVTTGDKLGTQPPVLSRGESQRNSRTVQKVLENTSFSEVVAILENGPIAEEGFEPPTRGL